MTTKHIPVSDPNHVPDILVTGPCNVHIAGHFLVLTCTAARPNVAQIFEGTHQRADVEAIVIARLVFTKRYSTLRRPSANNREYSPRMRSLSLGCTRLRQTAAAARR
jgi:hypothetical protein